MSLFTDDVMAVLRASFEGSTFMGAFTAKNKDKKLVLKSKNELLGGKKRVLRSSKLDSSKVETVVQKYNDSLLRVCNPVSPVDPSVLQSVVTKSYIEYSFREALEKPYMDFLGIFNEQDQLLSFIIPQLGECQVLPNVWSVNLICAVLLAGSGNILMAGMLYAAKVYYETNGLSDEKVVLELAQSYSNAQGLTNYTRLGFVKDPSLYYEETEANCLAWNTRNCFCEAGNLAMSNDLSRFTHQMLLDMLMGLRVAASDDSTGLLKARRMGFDKQKEAGTPDRVKQAITKKTDECVRLAKNLYEAEKQLVVRQRSGLDTSATETSVRDRTASLSACNQRLIKLTQEDQKPRKSAAEKLAEEAAAIAGSQSSYGPRRASRTPSRYTGSRSHLEMSPHRLQMSPHRLQMSPHRLQMSPHRLQMSPHRLQMSPHRLQMSPRRRHLEMSPRRRHIEMSPRRRHLETSPHHLQMSPRHLEMSPHRLEMSPRRRHLGLRK